MAWTAEAATHELLALLPLLNRIVATEVRREAGEETTMPQFRVLAYLSEGPRTLSTLAKQRRVSLQAMSELVQILVERGWVIRCPDPNDRRQSLLELTTHGQVHFVRAQRETLRTLVPLVSNLSTAELHAIEVGLPALRRVLMQDESDQPHGR
ncbi:MAG: hypothetical protein NVS4B8_19390 [Herpetosiphon sp.]